MLFFETRDTGVFKDDRNKLFASNKKQVDNHTLMLDMLYLDMLVVRTYNHCRSVSKKIFWCSCCSLLIFVAKKATIKALNFNFFVPRQCHPPSERVEDYRMMFIRNLHLLQSHIQAKLYIYKTDHMMSLYIPKSVCIFSILFSIQFLMCRQGEFV